MARSLCGEEGTRWLNPLDQAACEAVQQEKNRQNDTRLNPPHWSADFGELVFTNGSGRPMEPCLLGKDLRLELEMAASLLAFTGRSCSSGDGGFGHSQISTTMDIYTKVYPEVGGRRPRREVSRPPIRLHRYA